MTEYNTQEQFKVVRWQSADGVGHDALVEAGKVELDAPANRYLKRWQIRSTRFDPNGVDPAGV